MTGTDKTLHASLATLDSSPHSQADRPMVGVREARPCPTFSLDPREVGIGCRVAGRGAGSRLFAGFVGKHEPWSQVIVLNWRVCSTELSVRLGEPGALLSSQGASVYRVSGDDGGRCSFLPSGYRSTLVECRSGRSPEVCAQGQSISRGPQSRRSAATRRCARTSSTG